MARVSWRKQSKLVAASATSGLHQPVRPWHRRFLFSWSWVTVLEEGCDPRRAHPAHCLVLHCSSASRLKPAQGYCRSWLCA